MNTMIEESVTIENPEALMLRYKETRDVQTRNQLVMHYSFIAKTVAIQMRGISANYAQVEDIVNQGIITLIDCVEKFDPSKGIQFKSYAFMRVRGAVIDFVRKQDWFPRRVRMAAKNVSAAHDKLCNELMREPTMQEMADYLEIPLEVLNKNFGEISNSVMLSFEGIIQNIYQGGNVLSDYLDENFVPENSIFKKELHDTLQTEIEALSERERLVITLYYYEHLKLSDIAKILKVSDQRVSQINSKAVMKLKNKMERYMKG